MGKEIHLASTAILITLFLLAMFLRLYSFEEPRYFEVSNLENYYAAGPSHFYYFAHNLRVAIRKEACSVIPIFLCVATSSRFPIATRICFSTGDCMRS